VLGDLLGRGGMAEVFAGQSIGSHGFQKPVAIKRLLPELSNDHVFVERLIGEAKLLVGMQHGNVVSVLDLARDGDDVFLVMEFMDGPSVRQLLKARGDRGIPIELATYIVQAAAQGLEFAHGRPGGAVIHADISPSNILLTTSGEVRVADFGIARREGGSAGVVEGKWAYMAPEQARGEALTPRSDVFALGVVLYELICGQHPLGRQVTADERESARMRVIPPRVIKPEIPSGIEMICMRALAHDPRDRYARMQTMIDALIEERFANGWKEGANDLAQLIRQIAPGAAGIGPKTMITERPVTIVTRSLISNRASSQAIIDENRATVALDIPKIADSSAQTRALVIPDELPRVQVRADGTPPQLLQMAAAMLPSPELASVHGGTFTGSAQVDLAIGRPNYRWTLGVLGIAAIAGAVAALAFQLAPGNDDDATLSPEAIFEQAAASVPAEPPAPVVVKPAPAPAPTIDTTATAPAPAPDTTATQPAPAPAPDTTPATTPDQTPTLTADKPPEQSMEARLAAKRKAPAVGAKKVSPTPAADTILGVDEIDNIPVEVSIGNEIHYPPRARFTLRAGTYTLHVKSNSAHFSCKVTLEPARLNLVKVSAEDRSCTD
jgi:serine/threonine protein kinase